jgi:phenylalanyl-tRNA synthetase alpha chain
MSVQVLSYDALLHTLQLRDLTDPLQGPHALQPLVATIHDALATRWQCSRLVHRACPLMSVEDNYNNLGYPAGGAARNARYTRYVTPRLLLRTQTSAMIPPLLRALALDPPRDLLLVCPGLVYRRDAIDRWHTGEPHQLDLWRLTQGRLTPTDLREMIDTVVTAALPAYRYRTLPASHPYTTHGLQIDVWDGECWVEIGECGLTAPAVLDRAGLESAQVAGLAMGLGLDRLLMLRKGIEDIRLLRADDPRIAKQMRDLAPYVPVSRQPPIRRDLSVAVASALTAEDLGDRIREVLPAYLHQLESVEVLSEATDEELSPAARVRLGLRVGQKNVLVRLVLRDPARTLTRVEANTVCDLVYRAIHQGDSTEVAPAQP